MITLAITKTNNASKPARFFIIIPLQAASPQQLLKLLTISAFFTSFLSYFRMLARKFSFNFLDGALAA
jgi:hypothetical protein